MTQVEIINKALGHIAVSPITGMSEASPAAVLANSIWDSCRREVLRVCNWSFATVISALSTANYTIANNDWTYVYQYPSNCVGMWLVYANRKDKAQEFREVYDPINSAKVILSNVYAAIGEYTYDLIDTTGYDASFISCLSYLLAANMAKPLTGDDKMAEGIVKMYTTFVGEAQRLSSYENTRKIEQSSAFVDARDGTGMGIEDTYVAVRHPNG